MALSTSRDLLSLPTASRFISLVVPLTHVLLLDILVIILSSPDHVALTILMAKSLYRSMITSLKSVFIHEIAESRVYRILWFLT